EKPAEVDDGRVNLAVAAHDDVHDPAHVLVGAAANALAEDGGDLLVVEDRRRRAGGGGGGGGGGRPRGRGGGVCAAVARCAAGRRGVGRAASVELSALPPAPGRHGHPLPRSAQSQRQREIPDRYASVLSPVHANP